ncbi:MAG: rRNA maturation RNase YbeY [Planctomycetota bacterium]|nr:rRNA maturation RNase YbeY [Planctomycetota bacterium]
MPSDPLPDDSFQLEIRDQFVPATDPDFLGRVVSVVLAHVERPHMPVSLLLTDDAEIGRIHGEFLGDPSATDVLSFELDGGVDVVVSVERARQQALERGHAVEAELALYVTHGILHACGYDDVEPGDRAAMRVAERAVLGDLGLGIDDVDA